MTCLQSTCTDGQESFPRNRKNESLARSCRPLHTIANRAALVFFGLYLVVCQEAASFRISSVSESAWRDFLVCSEHFSSSMYCSQRGLERFATVFACVCYPDKIAMQQRPLSRCVLTPLGNRILNNTEPIKGCDSHSHTRINSIGSSMVLA